jgi:hypothetical protein
MKVIRGEGRRALNVVVSLCDFSGRWAQPWADAGHTVILMDLKHGDDVTRTVDALYWIDAACMGVATGAGVDVLLMAPPCTDFAASGAQYWARKDADGTTARAVSVVRSCLAIRDALNPLIWALENPVGRLNRCVPELAGFGPTYYQPHDFAGWADDPASEAYTKKTGLWGRFNRDLLVSKREPIRACAQGSWIQKLGGKSERTKELRSMTPQGFARAFYIANRGSFQL